LNSTPITPEQASAPAAKPAHSYGQILKSSSIIGGAQGINYLIGMVRTKLVAVLLGPSGVGLVGLYGSATGLVGTLAGLGIGISGVREVAEAHGSGNAEQVARTVKTLRRACWATGLLGWLLCAVLSYPLSVYTFGSGTHALAIACLGSAILIGSVSGGQSALIQGTRRIGDIARMGVLGATSGTILSVGLYAWLGPSGIVPVLIATAVANLGFSWWFARKIVVAPVPLTFIETVKNSKRLCHVGVAFMYGGLLTSFVDLAIRSLIVRKLGLDANGIYQAAWGISGMFAGFILNAMGTDFYPRLTAAAHDNPQMNRLVNEQIEIGILLALPGLLATLLFAPLLMHVFYSAKFVAGGKLLPWFIVGVFGQVMTWPMGFIQRAKGKSRWIFLSQTHLNIWNLVLVFALTRYFGLSGTAWGFALAIYIHGVLAFAIARRLSGFSWTNHSVRLALYATFLVSVAVAVQSLVAGPVELLLGGLVTGTACFASLRGVAARLGDQHRVTQLILKLPGGRLACGI